MKPTPEIEAKGLKAYEQARAFERLRTWRLPLVYGAAPVLLVGAAGFLVLDLGREGQAEVLLALAALMAVLGWSQWRQVERRHRQNVALLAELVKTYGDELPWVQVEKHFAALEQLKRELGEASDVVKT